MLQAIKNKKAGHNFKGTDIQWSNLFKGSEDSLTSSVIGTLLYLPHSVFWTIINQAFGEDIINIEEAIEDFEFWPSWKSEYTKKTNFIEPDVFIQTPNYHIIIEAKKTDGIGQNNDQWQRELIAYQNQYLAEDIKREVRFIALGGVSENKTIAVEISSFTKTPLPEDYECKFKVAQIQWKTLLKACLDYKYTLDSNNNYKNHALIRILNDVIEYFEIHKVYRLKHFVDITYPNYRVKDHKLYSFKLNKQL